MVALLERFNLDDEEWWVISHFLPAQGRGNDRIRRNEPFTIDVNMAYTSNRTRQKVANEDTLAVITNAHKPPAQEKFGGRFS